MKRQTLFLLAVFCMIGLSPKVQAQKVRLMDGDLAALSGVSKLNVVYDYSHMGVGKFDDESDYIKKKKSELNEKESGRGNSWEKSWIADRKNLFEPQFEELFMKTSGLTIGDFPNEKYTLIFKTTYTEPGYNIYVSKKSASIDAEVWVVETADQSKVLAKYSIHNAPGRMAFGADYATGDRLKESYATAGKQLGKTMKKALK